MKTYLGTVMTSLKIRFASLILLSLFWGVSASLVAQDDPLQLNEAESFEINNKYAHQWIKLPSLHGRSVKGGDSSFKTSRGSIQVYVFMASWCLACQRQVGRVKELQRRYEPLSVQFIYVLEDNFADAVSFAETYNLDPAIVSTDKILKEFHYPRVPAYYVGDRWGWIGYRSLEASISDLKILDQVILDLAAI